MTSSKFITIPTVVAGALGLSAGAVKAAEPTTEELMKQIEQLQSKVQQLETKQQTLATQDVDATVEAVLRDADKRSQLLQMEGFTAGWTKDKGFRIQDAAGNWVLHPFFQFQFRSTTNFRHDGKQVDDDDIENGFEIRRMKIGFSGNACSPDLTYYFLWATTNSNDDQDDSDSGNDFSVNGLALEQAWIKYYFNDAWAFRVGQIRNPAVHEHDTSSSMLMAADRSLMVNLLTGTNEPFTQAVTLVYDQKDNPIQAEFGVGDGFISGNTDFVDKNEGASTNWGVFGRVNYYVQGTRDQYKDFTAHGNKNDLLVIGAGGDVTEYGDAIAYLHTVDVQWENTGGLGVYAAYLGNYLDAADSDETYNWGFLVQAGYMLNDKWELFGRYDYTKLDDDIVSTGHDEFCEVTLGVNWFLCGTHDVKVTVDMTWLPNGAPSDLKGLGFLATEDDEVVIRGQFQLLL